MSRKPIPDNLNKQNPKRANFEDFLKKIDIPSLEEDKGDRSRTTVSESPKKSGRKTALNDAEKLNLYMSARTKQRLEDVLPVIRKQLPRKRGGIISYSLILQVCADICFDELDQHGASSKLVREIIKIVETT